MQKENGKLQFGFRVNGMKEWINTMASTTAFGLYDDPKPYMTLLFQFSCPFLP